MENQTRQFTTDVIVVKDKHAQTCGGTLGVAKSSSSPGPSQPAPSAPGFWGFYSQSLGSRLHFYPRWAPAERLPDSDTELGKK